MNVIKKALASVALTAVVAAPISANAAEAQRAATPVHQSEKLLGGANVFLVLGIFVGLLLIGEATGAFHIFSDDDHAPTSP